MNKTRRDRIRKENMAGTQPVFYHIETQRIKWFGHLDTKQEGGRESGGSMVLLQRH